MLPLLLRKYETAFIIKEKNCKTIAIFRYINIIFLFKGFQIRRHEWQEDEVENMDFPFPPNEL
jgi:hypothetical protein